GGHDTSAEAAIAVSVTPGVDNPPFEIGADQSSTDEAPDHGPALQKSVTGWAKNIFPGGGPGEDNKTPTFSTSHTFAAGSGHTFTKNGTTTSGSNSVSGVGTISELRVGMFVSGTGIPAGTTVTAINSATSTLTLSNNATASGTVSLTYNADLFTATGKPKVD